MRFLRNKINKKYGKEDDWNVPCLSHNFSHQCELTATPNADGETAYDCLMYWRERYGLPNVFVTDQGSHYCNPLFNSISDCLNIFHEKKS